MTWQDALLIGLTLAIAALTVFTYRQMRHEGRRRLFIIALAGGLLLTTAAGAYAYITAQHRESSLRAQIQGDLSAVSSAESQQEVDRSQRKLRQAFSNLDDALGRFGRGESPPLDVRPNVDDYSDSSTVINARSHLDETSRELAALDAPWPAARGALLVGLGVIALLLLAYWPIQWSRAGFEMEAGRFAPASGEPVSDVLGDVEAEGALGGDYDPRGRSIGKRVAIIAGLIAVVGALILFNLPNSETDAGVADTNGDSASPAKAAITPPKAKSTATVTSVPTTLAPPPASKVSLAKVTANWLVGTWAGAEHNPANNPTASCDTDVTITFSRGGRFRDGGATGQYKTDSRSIIYYDRVSVADEANPDSDPGGDPLEDVTAVASVVDENTFREGSDVWRRCVSG